MNEAQPLILVSTSPQRSALMAHFGLPFSVVAPKLTQETLRQDCSLADAVAFLAYEKAASVQRDFSSGLLIGCDTIVVVDETVLGKPLDDAEAFMMLQRLSGRTHFVRSGLAVLDAATGASRQVCVETQVKMRSLTEKEISAYIAYGESRGRAGAYAIQDKGMLLTESIHGSWSNVVGLPLEALLGMLKNWGVDPLS